MADALPARPSASSAAAMIFPARLIMTLLYPPPHAVAAEGKTRAVCVNARGRLLPSRFGETCSGRLFRGSGNGLPELGVLVTQGP
ncbi:hypothetical protein Q1M63_17590 [Sinorhizobium meliloti]|nr:hypothetical protein Q1M63_17590 [Sinorhizobium meliloti]